jgi:hypothetical protein
VAVHHALAARFVPPFRSQNGKACDFRRVDRGRGFVENGHPATVFLLLRQRKVATPANGYVDDQDDRLDK